MVPQNNQDQNVLGPWKEWAKYIIAEIERLTTFTIDLAQGAILNRKETDAQLLLFQQKLTETIINANIAVAKEITELKVEIAVLKTKAALWGAIGATIPVVIGIIVELLRKK